MARIGLSSRENLRIISAWQQIVANLHIESVNIFSESLRSREIYGVGFIYGFSVEVDDVKQLREIKSFLRSLSS